MAYVKIAHCSTAIRRMLSSATQERLRVGERQSSGRERQSGRASESSAAGWGLKDNGLERRLLRCGLSCLKIRTAAAAEGEAGKEAAQQQRQKKKQHRNSSRVISSAAEVAELEAA